MADAYTDSDGDRPWWNDRGHMATVAEHMLATGRGPDELVRLIEKPWSHDDEWRETLVANPGMNEASPPCMNFSAARPQPTKET